MFFQNSVIALDTEGIFIYSFDQSLKKNKMHLIKFINRSVQEMVLTDVCRELHPLERDYTHYSIPHSVYFRIDYFLMKCKIGVADHNAISLTIHLNSIKINAVWRLSVGILNNKTNMGTETGV